MIVKTAPNRVLVADDDPVIRCLVSAILKQRGYTAVAVNDGREALRVLQTDANFRAAIFDMSMPYLEGMDIIRHMRTEKRLMRIPVMLITADQSIMLLADSFAAGATAFLPKPFTGEQLDSALRMLLGSQKPVEWTRAA